MTEINSVYKFTVYGKPVGKQRPRLGRGGKVFTPQKTKDYEAAIAYEAARTFLDDAFTERGVTVEVRCYFSTKVHSDLDNVIKSVMDGMNGIAFTDDRLVDELHGFVFYCDKASEQRVEVMVYETQKTEKADD